MKQIKTLEEMQQINFEMMMYLKQIADRNDIKLMLSGGTLLGAVRHKDFIPWDDDVDTMVLRKDYDRLIRCIEEDKSSIYRIMTVKNEKTYQYPFAKLVDTRTWQDDRKAIEIKGMGIAADIFPIDALPRNAWLRKKLIRFIGFKTYEIYDLRDTNYRGVKNEHDYRKRLAWIRMDVHMINALLKPFSLKRASHAAVAMGQYKEREIMRKKDMTECVKVSFHGEEFWAPKGYKRYLSSLYGPNYMQLPPKIKQKPKHVLNLYWK